MLDFQELGGEIELRADQREIGGRGERATPVAQPLEGLQMRQGEGIAALGAIDLVGDLVHVAKARDGGLQVHAAERPVEIVRREVQGAAAEIDLRLDAPDEGRGAAVVVLGQVRQRLVHRRQRGGEIVLLGIG